MTEFITADVGAYGKVKGFTKGNIAEFRGVPFATIPARFRRAELVDSHPEGIIDATKYGPYPPQLLLDKTLETVLFGEHAKTFWDEEETCTRSEDQCLNVNIVVPKDAIGSNKKLPVLVWIYGGGFSIGCNSKGMYNGASIVEHSIQFGEPVIYVSVNYRVNYFGFLASNELAKDNASRGGGVGNYGLHDQRVALEWIQKHISCFGGDPSEVTICGESAGSGSVHAHIVAGKPLFTRAIMQSGVLADCLGPVPLWSSRVQGDFDRLVKRFGLEDQDDQGKVDGLRAVPINDLIKAATELGPFPIFSPVDDSHLPGAFFEKGREETQGWLYHPNSPNFIKAVIAGDVENEGVIFVQSLRTLDVNKVLKLMHTSLPDSLVSKYGLSESQTKNVSSIEEIVGALSAYKSDEFFSAATERFNQAISKTSVDLYSYHFDRGNPFDGPLHGIANHALDLVYVFGNFLEAFADKRDVDLSTGIMRFWIGFTNGKAPWAGYTSGKALYITPEAKLSVVPREEVVTRRWDAYAEIEENWKQVTKVGRILTNGTLEVKSELSTDRKKPAL